MKSKLKSFFTKNWKTLFADVIIVISIIAGALITANTLIEYKRLDTPLPAGVVVALMGFWGGELLIIALRQIFGSDVVAKAQTTNTEEPTI